MICVVMFSIGRKLGGWLVKRVGRLFCCYCCFLGGRFKERVYRCVVRYRYDWFEVAGDSRLCYFSFSFGFVLGIDFFVGFRVR